MLAGRDSERLDSVARDLGLRGAKVTTFAADLAKVDAEQSLSEMIVTLGGIDVVLLAYGVLGDQKLAEKQQSETDQILASNFTSAVQWCLAAANVFEAQGHGTLIVIGSVAGDRGRASNYIYGAGKAGLAVFTEGLAHRLARTGASRAILIKLGLVDTPMTASVSRKGVLWTQPKAIADIIVKACASKTIDGGRVIYAPWFWRWIMWVVRHLPNSILHRTNL